MKEPLPFGKAARRIGVGVNKDVAMIERADQTQMPRHQHAIAKDVARHVSDTDDGHIVRLDVASELAEMAFDEFPSPARGDAHRLVVVARRAARGERIAEPKTI